MSGEVLTRSTKEKSLQRETLCSVRWTMERPFNSMTSVILKLQNSSNMVSHEESNIQIHCVKMFRLMFPNLSRVLFAVPNGGNRDRVTGAILKAEGVVAGVADLLLLHPSGKYHGLCIEMKTPKGRQQPSQVDWQKEVEHQGYKYVVCHSVDEFMEEVNTYMEVNR